ncbi:MAG: hypothetical protein PHZ07_00270 [Patescibacteria group bacterium]|nr:hypothetical protein [Patescibacteria group bacterium]MDD4304161.1 hypothetical protein [Patescibacteria group bacterium]MDD4695192.1 hypothetical protein [Patescibacteria group bacterium]
MKNIYSTVLFLDSRSREIFPEFGSMTQTLEGLIFRLGIKSPVEARDFFPNIRDGAFICPFPTFIPLEGYNAQSSAGFVRIVGVSYSNATLLGGIFSAGKGLFKTKESLQGLLLPPETLFRWAETHKNLNCNTADAVLEGLYARQGHMGLYIVEGQSNYARALYIQPPKGWRGEIITFPWEHRTDIFGPVPTEVTQEDLQPSESPDLTSSSEQECPPEEEVLEFEVPEILVED